MFDGAFAAVDIKEGDLVEKGLMRRLPEGFDGNTCPYIFTWSTERPNKVRKYMFSCAGDVISDAGLGMQGLGLGGKGNVGKCKSIGLRIHPSPLHRCMH